MGQLVGAIQGIGAACSALDMPIVSGNVSLYNETDGSAILPTPTIGAVGLLDSVDEIIPGTPQRRPSRDPDRRDPRSSGPVGAAGRGVQPRRGRRAPGRSGRRAAHGEFLRANRALIAAATDLSDGGLALAAFEMAEAAGIGVTLDDGDPAHALSARIRRAISIACGFDQAEALMVAAGQAGIPVAAWAASAATGSAWAQARPRWPIFRRSIARPSPPPWAEP
jgi:phosphoribosylformylglycinamidine synthase subunit PurL